jgi:hypothetical protein
MNYVYTKKRKACIPVYSLLNELKKEKNVYGLRRVTKAVYSHSLPPSPSLIPDRLWKVRRRGCRGRGKD